jgi:hypothetical protein
MNVFVPSSLVELRIFPWMWTGFIWSHDRIEAVKSAAKMVWSGLAGQFHNVSGDVLLAGCHSPLESPGRFQEVRGLKSRNLRGHPFTILPQSCCFVPLFHTMCPGFPVGRPLQAAVTQAWERRGHRTSITLQWLGSMVFLFQISLYRNNY